MSETIWSPRVDSSAVPIYRAIADALERDLGRGVLREGQRLPTHRELAAALDVAPLTVTRAYAPPRPSGRWSARSTISPWPVRCAIAWPVPPG